MTAVAAWCHGWSYATTLAAAGGLVHAQGAMERVAEARKDGEEEEREYSGVSKF